MVKGYIYKLVQLKLCLIQHKPASLLRFHKGLLHIKDALFRPAVPVIWNLDKAHWD